MAKKKPARAAPVSPAPLTPDQALAAALRVKLSDVKKLKAKEAGAKKGKGKTTVRYSRKSWIAGG